MRAKQLLFYLFAAVSSALPLLLLFNLCCYCLILTASLSLFAELRGPDLNRNPQQGHHSPSHLMKISQP
jgi:hypothetical protein